MMVEDHTTAQNQLEEIASDLNIATPDTLDAAHQAIRAQLSALSGYQFDSAYIRNQVLDNELAQEIIQTEIDEGENERLVGYADQTLPIINQHLEEVLELQTEVIENNNSGTDVDTGTNGDANGRKTE
jgi:putative membrane protein